jgi:hypothetical protein
MATTVREYSLDYYLFDHMRCSGIERENLEDLFSIVTSLKNKYGIVPFAVTPHGQPVPNGLTARYLVESITLNKIRNVLLLLRAFSRCASCHAAFPNPISPK